MFLPYQFSQKLHGFLDLLGRHFAVRSSYIVARFRGISHESMSRYKSNTLLQASTHQHVIHVGDTLHFYPDEHPASWNVPFAKTFQVTFHGIDGQISTSFVVFSDETQVLHEFVMTPDLEEVFGDDLKQNQQDRNTSKSNRSSLELDFTGFFSLINVKNIIKIVIGKQTVF